MRPPLTRPGPSTLPEDEQCLLNAIAPERMWRDLEFFSGFDRASGTDGERRAMDYIAERLRAEGIAVEVYAFDAYLSDPIGGSITVIGGQGLPAQITAKTRAFSGNTPPEGVSAEVVSVPGGSDLFRDTETHRRLAGAGVAGKIVLSEGRQPPQHAGRAGTGGGGVPARMAERRRRDPLAGSL